MCMAIAKTRNSCGFSRATKKFPVIFPVMEISEGMVSRNLEHHRPAFALLQLPGPLEGDHYIQTIQESEAI